MPFGRSPIDPFSSPGARPGPTAGARLDAPYADSVADGFGDRAPRPDGFGRPPAPLAAGPGAALPSPERPVTYAELQDLRERDVLIGAYSKMMASKFDAMTYAMNTTCDALEVRKPKCVAEGPCELDLRWRRRLGPVGGRTWQRRRRADP